MVRTEALDDLRELIGVWSRENVRVSSVAEAEEVALEVRQMVGEVVVAETLGEMDRRDTYRGTRQPCECGAGARFVSYRNRGVSTIAGMADVTRAYYHCGECRSGQLPWDVEQGLNGRLWSPGVKALVAELAAHLPYEVACGFLERMLGIRLEESSAEQIVAEVGERVRAEQSEAMGQVADGTLELPDGPGVERLYVTMDGSHAHIDGQWHEVKTGAVYEAEPDSDGRDRCGPKRHISAQEPAEQFGDRLYVTAVGMGVHRADEVVVIGDGAAWIWNLARHHYHGAIEIVDYWHACEHIWELSRVQYGEGNECGRRWASDHCRKLRRHGPDRLLRALRRMKPATPEATEALAKQRAYFTNNAHRMQYHRFRQRGLMIGSGVAEAACKVVVGHRLKRSGMRWTHRGADAVLALRCLVLNDQTDTLQRCARAAA